MGMSSTGNAHRISWFVYAGRDKIRRTATMRGTWGYDVECSCGWATHTGGATRRYVESEVWFHKHIDNDGPQEQLASLR